MKANAVENFARYGIEYFQTTIARRIRSKLKIVRLTNRNHLLRGPDGLLILRQVATILGKCSPPEKTGVVSNLNPEVRHEGVKVDDPEAVLDTLLEVNRFRSVEPVHQHKLELIRCGAGMRNEDDMVIGEVRWPSVPKPTTPS
jgi:hypothetical protein